MSTMTLTPSPTIRLRAPQVRLTRRGRLVVFAGALLLVLALGVLWGSGSVATEQPGTADPTLVVQVEAGDTLYDIAARVTTDGDVAAMVEQIEDLNRLDTSVVYAGQKLRVPVES
jgi:ABC-type transporter Mla subunit MlaD